MSSRSATTCRYSGPRSRTTTARSLTLSLFGSCLESLLGVCSHDSVDFTIPQHVAPLRQHTQAVHNAHPMHIVASSIPALKAATIAQLRSWQSVNGMDSFSLYTFWYQFVVLGPVARSARNVAAAAPIFVYVPTFCFHPPTVSIYPTNVGVYCSESRCVVSQSLLVCPPEFVQQPPYTLPKLEFARRLS